MAICLSFSIMDRDSNGYMAVFSIIQHYERMQQWLYYHYSAPWTGTAMAILPLFSTMDRDSNGYMVVIQHYGQGQQKLYDCYSQPWSGKAMAI